MLSSFSLSWPSSTDTTDSRVCSKIFPSPSIMGLAEEAAAAAAAAAVEARVAESAGWPPMEGDDISGAPAWENVPSAASMSWVVGGDGGCGDWSGLFCFAADSVAILMSATGAATAPLTLSVIWPPFVERRAAESGAARRKQTR